MRHLHVDIETFSELDLLKCGTYRYAMHPSTEIMLISYSLGNAPVVNIDMIRVAENDRIETKKLGQFLTLVESDDVIKWSHNAQFETSLFNYASNSPLRGMVPYNQWRCTMVLAHYVSLLGALKHVGTVLRLPDNLQKLTEGRRLILKFCKPRKPSKFKPHLRCTRHTDPVDWELFISYCNNDVEAEREIHIRLKKWDMPEHEWQLYFLDQKINRAGLPIDRELVDAAILMGDQASLAIKEDITERFGLNVSSPAQIKSYLYLNGHDVEDTTKGTLTALLKTNLSDEIRYVITARLDVNKASIKKFHALQRAANDDDRVRGCFQFGGGSRTLRWAGRIFQPQNLARGNLKPSQIPAARQIIVSRDIGLINLCYGSANEVLPNLVRSAIRAPEGKKIVVADLASIESIMVAWACDSSYMLELFRNGLDPYIDYASHLYGIPYISVTKEQRSFAKPAFLGCCYKLGAKGLIRYSAGFGLELSLDEAQRQVDVYRKSYNDVVQFWYRLDRAARRCIKTEKPQTETYFTFSMDGPFMRVLLPSGRYLSYLRPKIENCVAPWDKSQIIQNIFYEGMNQDTNQWERVRTHSGKITENFIQAIARDILAAGLVNTDTDPRLEIIGHVHDEIICLADEDDDTALSRLIGHMTKLPEWCPDVPISAAGFESKFYLKD